MIRLEKKAEILSGYLGEWLVALCTQSRYVPRLLKSDRIRNYPEAEGFYGRVRSLAVVRRLRRGATAKVLEALQDFVRSVEFDHIGVFTYSHEEGTSAHDLTDDVPAATKRKRQDRLMARQRDIVAARQQARVGERTRLVVDGQSPEHELVLQGRLQGQAPEIDPVVYLTDCDPSMIAKGSFIDVEIVGSEGYDLIARPL